MERNTKPVTMLNSNGVLKKKINPQKSKNNNSFSMINLSEKNCDFYCKILLRIFLAC